MQIFYGLMIPFLGTVLGSACVFFMGQHINEKLQKLLLGFASGVMVAASVWSLLIPSMESSAHLGRLAFLPAVIGMSLGMAFLFLLDIIIPHLHMNLEKPEGLHVKLRETTMLCLAVTLHNIPEGMAVGVAFAAVLVEKNPAMASAALALSVGIAVQNFPEGAIVSMPLASAGEKKGKALLWGIFFGRGGAFGCACHAGGFGLAGACHALVFKFCGGRHVLCGCGGADSRNGGRCAPKDRRRQLCRRIFGDDDFGRSAGVIQPFRTFFCKKHCNDM